MTDYTKNVNYADKDTLPTGNAAKVIKGTELNAEFAEIETCIATKPDANNAALTGTPTAPTAATTTDTTQIATTEFVWDIVEQLYPVGSIYVNATNATNPGTLLGFGTWVAFGAGRVAVGFDATNTHFDAAEETGGSEDAKLITHNHTADTSNTGNHQHGVGGNQWPTGGGTYYSAHDNTAAFHTGVSSTSWAGYSGYAGNHSHTVTVDNAEDASGATDGTGDNLQPYITVYMWKRTV